MVGRSDGNVDKRDSNITVTEWSSERVLINVPCEKAYLTRNQLMALRDAMTVMLRSWPDKPKPETPATPAATGKSK